MLEKLKDKGYLILDGAMGSNLFLLGLISGDSPEVWNLEHPERVKKSYIRLSFRRVLISSSPTPLEETVIA